MGLHKGQTNNPKGRPKGKPNKATGDLRQWINSFIDQNRDQMQRDWKKLQPRERIFLFEKLLKYSLPTLQSTSLTADIENMTEEQLDYIIEKIKEGKMK